MLTPLIEKVEILEDYNLLIFFKNGEKNLWYEKKL